MVYFLSGAPTGTFSAGHDYPREVAGDRCSRSLALVLLPKAAAPGIAFMKGWRVQVRTLLGVERRLEIRSDRRGAGRDETDRLYLSPTTNEEESVGNLQHQGRSLAAEVAGDRCSRPVFLKAAARGIAFMMLKGRK